MFGFEGVRTTDLVFDKRVPKDEDGFVDVDAGRRPNDEDNRLRLLLLRLLLLLVRLRLPLNDGDLFEELPRKFEDRELPKFFPPNPDFR